MDAKTLCLGALVRGPATGYEIRKMFEEGAYAALHPIGFGSIYPALTALLADGLVACQEEASPGRPGKKVYSLTPEGHAVLASSFANTQPAEDKYKSDTLFMLSLADVMEPERVRQLLSDYRAVNMAGLQEMEACDARNMPAGERFVFGLGLTVYSTIVDYLENNTDGLIDALKAETPFRKAGE